jgi:hypothetical protein
VKVLYWFWRKWIGPHFGLFFNKLLIRSPWKDGQLRWDRRPPFASHQTFCSSCQASPRKQGCQIVCFQTKNPNLGKFWRALELKMMLYFMFVWNILQTLYTFYCHYVMLW